MSSKGIVKMEPHKSQYDLLEEIEKLKAQVADLFRLRELDNTKQNQQENQQVIINNNYFFLSNDSED
jgi:hypothetical protein